MAFKKGNIPWNKNKVGIYSKETIKKMSESHKGMKKPWVKKYCLFGKKARHWKGDDASSKSIHAWIRKQKGIPKVCEHCGRTNKETRLYYANIKNHIYTRNPDDYISLCGSCHKKYDIKNKNRLKELSKK